MILYSVLISLFCINSTHSFLLRKSSIKMINSLDYASESDIIYKYRNLLSKDNYNNVIQDVLDKKIDKIFINNDYKQIISVDNLPKDDILLNHYHITSINPIVLPNLVEKTTQTHIPIFLQILMPKVSSIVKIHLVY